MRRGRAPRVAVGAAVGAAVSAALARRRVEQPGRAPVRPNWRGRAVPVVLGEPVVIGGLAGLAAVSALGYEEQGGAARAAAVALAGMGIAGWWDDHRLDEGAKGFAGHLGAARRGRITGGLVKLAAGGATGLTAGALVADGREAVEVGACVALTANLVNLLDRAPGRAGKSVLAAGLPLVAAAPGWAGAAAGTLGAVAAVLPADLGERGMLGDTGANPAGAVAGLGLACALPRAPRLAAIVALLALNLASERRSFSAVIDATPWLRAVDRFGRSG